QGRAALTAGEEGEHVAGAQLEVEQPPRAVALAQVEGGEVPDLPVCLGMIVAGHLDQLGVEVHAYHPVAGAGEMPAEPPGAAAGVEDPGASRGHGVDQPCLAVDVLAG